MQNGNSVLKETFMKRFSPLVTAMVMVLAAGGTGTFARSPGKMPAKADDNLIIKAPAATDLRVLTLRDLKDSEEKLISLAESIPADKYGWRPATGVRSISEVFMHVANANFFYPTFLGVQPPASVKDQNLEKTVTEKAKVVQMLKDSFAHLEKAVEGIPDDQMAKTFDYFGGQMSTSELLFHAANHEHEHLGQLIAYARMNGVTPPWSMPRPSKDANRK
jgi:uncharacterized damage-inducible protein DinB